MARDGGVFCLRRSEMMSVSNGGIESLPLDEVHVLAVDDSLVDRIVIERLLRITSCKVTAVDSGWRALEFLGLNSEKASIEFDRLKVDMIITDYCMPGMTGYELLKKIKKSSNFREVPVVIMSSENVLTRIDRCREEGAEDFLLKPVKLADVKRLRNYLTRDVNLSNGNKRKLPEDSEFIHPMLPPSPPSTILAESLVPSPPLTISLKSLVPSPPLTISPKSSDSIPSLTISPESSASSPPLSPAEILSLPLSSPIDDKDDDMLTTSPSPDESPIRLNPELD